jgi:Bacterial Ig-like domain (group 2)/NHL repeat
MVPTAGFVSGARPFPRKRLNFCHLILAGLLLPAAAQAQVSYTGTAANQNFGSEAIGSTSTAKTFSFSVAAGTTVGSIGVVTQGAPNLDFTSATGGTCTATTYATAATCTVNVTFKPKFAGLRMGAVVFFSAAGNTGTVLGEVPIYGTGTGPQIAYSPGAVVNILSELGGSSVVPNGTVEDGFGNVVISDLNGNGVVRVSPGGHGWTEIYPSANGIPLNYPAGLAVDGVGNLFIANQGGASVLEIQAGDGTAIAIQPAVDGTGLNQPAGVAVDAAGDLFIGDYGNNRVVEVPAGNGGPILIDPTVAGKTLNQPAGVALDEAGDLFIADVGNNRVVEVPAGGGAATAIAPTVNGLGLSSPTQVVVDGAGDLFIADHGNNRVVEVPARGGAATATQLAGQTQLNWVSLDDAGDQFISASPFLGQAGLVEVLRSQPPTLNFSTATAVGTTDTTDGTQTAQIQNIGNEVLVLTALNYPADFSEASRNANVCTHSTSLSAGQECDLPIEFTPENVGALSEDVMLTDNALNAAPPEYAQQSISLTGTGFKLNSIVITPSSSFATFVGGSQQFTATGSYSDGTTQNLTSQVSWSSSNTNAVAIGVSGLSTAQAVGAATITASLDGVTSNAVTFTVDSVQQPSIAVSSGSGQSTYETAAFANPLAAVVKDTSGNRLQGVQVTFTAPSSGAGALFSNGTATIVANTDATGTATVTLTADATAGSYNVTATVGSLSASFSLTNLASWPVYSVTTLVDDPVGLGTNCTDPTIKITSCSLRDAVTAASALPQATATPVTAAMMPTINFASSLNLSAQSPGDYNITNGGTLSISANMNIVGPGAKLLSLNGAENYQIFSVNSGTIFLSGLSLVNGQGCNGGAISSNGTLTLTNSTFSGNSATCGNGGGIYNNGTLTLTNSTFSGNSATGGSGYDGDGSDGNGGGGSGGGIYNGGTLTVTNSTFSGNSATGGAGGNGPYYCGVEDDGGNGAGGGISNGGTLTVTNSTFSGNSAIEGAGGSAYPPYGPDYCDPNGWSPPPNGNAYGGGIYNGGALTVANSIFSGNSANDGGGGIDGYDYGAGIYNSSVANADSGVYFNNLADGSEDDCNGCTANTKAVSGNPLLAAPGNYGGATLTMLPQPGSAAICAGAVGDIPVGVTTDQRGFARTNSTYEGGTVCVDAGSVQTHYAMAFTTEPPAVVLRGQAILPAPAVALTESGAAATAVASSVAMTDSDTLLSGTTTASFLSGTATFSNLLIPSVTDSDKLIATLALNPTINLTAQSTAFQAQTVIPAELTSPKPGSVLAGPSVTFAWTAGTGATEYNLWLGLNGAGSSDLYNSGVTAATSASVTGLPTKGATIYARLFWLIGTGWHSTDYTYTEATAVLAALTSPTPGTMLGSSNIHFTWTAGVGVTSYNLWLGLNGVGSSNLYNSGATTSTSAIVPTLPAKGGTIYARLFSDVAGRWESTDYTYTAATAALATITSPTPGTTLGTTNVAFTWTAGTGVVDYALWVGLSGPGSSDLYNSGQTTLTSATIPTLPAKGATLYVRLFSDVGGEWESTDYTYTEQ